MKTKKDTKTIKEVTSKSKKDKKVSYGNNTLIICEKPQASQKIADALSGGTEELIKDKNGVSYYQFNKDGKSFLVGCAVGHLFGIKQNAVRGEFPSFDVSWSPNYESKTGAYTKKYYDVLKHLAADSNELIVATDYDVEGEVIGWNVVRFIAKRADAKRMKFSSLTKDELQESWEHLQPTINWGEAYAGETRHFLDWFYGINLSRGLMRAISKTGQFRILSIGRVQGPALNIIYEKEMLIKDFKPEPYWQVFLRVKDLNKQKLELKFPKDLTDEKELARFKYLKGQKGVAKTEITTEQIPAPFPFDLTTLQTEAYRYLGMTPSQTLTTAQSLYLDGIISYPRTSSQQYPVGIGYDKILKKLQKHTTMVKYAVNLKPTEGPKTDPAHPAIYPTGDQKEMNEQEKKLYDLIVKRFIACFCAPAITENKKVTVTVSGMDFNARGLKIVEKNWLNVYPNSYKDEDIPTMNGEVSVEEIRTEEKMTKPPQRYSAASLVKELEKKELGTKCLTGDTRVILDGKEKKIEEIFNDAKKDIKNKEIEIRKIQSKGISLCKDGEAIVTDINCISRRKIKENEEIIKIEFTSGTIKVTGEHRVYISKNGKIVDIPAKELKITDKLVGLLKRYSEGEILQDKLEIGNNLKIQNGDVINRFSSKKSTGIKQSKFPIRWSTSLAWILGYFYGDGSYSNPRYNGSHQISFCTTEKKALNLLRENISCVFGNSPYCYNLGDKYKIDCNGMISAILIKMFPELDGKCPLNIPREFVGDFLRGFFDADGNVHLRPIERKLIKGVERNSFDTPRVKMTLANRSLIEWISRLLDQIGVDNHINKNISRCNGKIFDCWTILISGKDRIERFAFEVGFDSYKNEILYRGLKCNSQHYEIIKNCANIYLSLCKKELCLQQIIELTGLERYQSRMALIRLVSLGLISKRRIGNGSKQKWLFFVKEKNHRFLNHCIKLLFNRIKEDIYELPVTALSKKRQRAYVYDLSVDKDSPNFLAEGNILVHNSTRSNIVETLYSRGYIKEKSIELTPLGLKIIQTLQKYSPTIIDEELTRKIEKEMEDISGSKSGWTEKENKVIEAAKVIIRKIAKGILDNLEKIGNSLAEATAEVYKQEREANTLTECPVCKKGKLRIMFSRKTKKSFISCNAYPECKTIFSLPPNGLMKPAKKKIEGTDEEQNELCMECGFPMIMALRKGKRPWKFCFNPKCKTNEAWAKKREEYMKQKEEDAKPGEDGLEKEEVKNENGEVNPETEES